MNDLLDVVRRIEFALGKHSSEVEREGPALWDALVGDGASEVDRHELERQLR